MTNRYASLRVQLGRLLGAWQLVYTAAPRWTIAWVVLLIIQGLLPVASVYLTRLLVNSLVATIKTNGSWETLQLTLIFAVMMAAIMITIELLQGLSEQVRTAQSELVQDHIKNLIHAKAVAVDLNFYESPDFHDRLYRVTSEAGTRPLALIESTGNLLQNGLTLVGMALVLIPYGAWLPVVLVISTLPALFIVLYFNRRFHRWWEQTTADRRWTQYYDTMLTNSATAAEIRLFSLGTPFREAYQALRGPLRKQRLKLTRAQSHWRLVASMFSLLITGGALVVLTWRVLQGILTLGDLALCYQAFSSGQNLMRSLLGNVGQIYSNSLFLGNLFEFLELEPKVVDSPHPIQPPAQLQRGICFRGVTFRYAHDGKAALCNLNLTVPAGKVVAVVGPNGAGKSTLVKLLCRFYDPQMGSIELDGLDLRDMPVEQIRNMITVLFQFPVPYHATAAENIAVADLAAAPDQAEIEAAARSGGAHETICGLPRGYATLLGKWFADGVELSAGEWQRLALARAYIRRAQIIVLDEPTSFMDSWAEADWFERLRALVAGRTAIVITHRFTVAMRADMIHVMREGQVVESGTHSDLLAHGGLYGQSWDMQMQAAASVSFATT